MNTLRISLLPALLLAAFSLSARTTVTLTGAVGTRQLSELSKTDPDLQVLDLSEARIEGGVIPSGAFAGMALTSLTLPSTGSITIGDGAFMGTSLTEVVIPASVKRIGSGAFAACNSLRYITLAGSEISPYAFHLCPALEWAELGATTTVGAHAFAGCEAMRTFTHSGALKAIDDFAFAHTGLIAARLADCPDLTRVGAWAFACDSSLTVITLPADAALGEGVLFGCPALRKIVLPANLSEIPAYAFTGSTGSSGYYELPDGVESIGAFAYKDTDLGHMVLPEALRSIGSYAMENTPRLSIIDAGKVGSVPELGENVWAGVDKTKVDLLVPEELTDAYRAALQWQDFRLGIAGTDSPSAAPVSVRAAFDGDNLVVESTGSDIVRIEIFNEAGAAFVARDTHASIISIPVGNLGLKIYLVRCVQADGSVATAKLTR